MVRMPILTLLVLAGAAVPPANSCMCAVPGPPCAEYWNASAVFAGTVREIRAVPDRPGIIAATFDVDRRGEGVRSDTVVVESQSSGGSIDACGFTFLVGQRYVVYAHRTSSGRLTTSGCSGTKAAAMGQADLAFLEEVTGPPRGVRVTGRVHRRDAGFSSRGPHDGPVPGARVRLAGDRAARETVTGPDGEYDFRDLPVGTYTVTVTPPRGLAVDRFRSMPEYVPPSLVVNLWNPSECFLAVHTAWSDAQISGVLLDADGKPAGHRMIELIAVASTVPDRDPIRPASIRTDSDGRFTFAFVAPGTYLVGVSVRNPPPSSSASRVYYPGVTDGVQATEVTVDTGGRIQLTPFQLPDRPR